MEYRGIVNRASREWRIKFSQRPSATRYSWAVIPFAFSIVWITRTAVHVSTDQGVGIDLYHREQLYRMFAKMAVGWPQLALQFSATSRKTRIQAPRTAAEGYLGKFGRLRKLRSILRRRLCPVCRAKDAPKPTLTIH